MTLGERMGSDHKILTIRIGKTTTGKTDGSGMREVWRTDRLPETAGERHSFVWGFRTAMGAWMDETTTKIEMMEAVDTEANRIADILEWSFQAKLDKVCKEQLGTKIVGPKSTPMLTKAMKMLRDHHKICEGVVKEIMADGTSKSGDRAKAVEMYRNAKKEPFRATNRRK